MAAVEGALLLVDLIDLIDLINLDWEGT